MPKLIAEQSHDFLITLQQ